MGCNCGCSGISRWRRIGERRQSQGVEAVRADAGDVGGRSRAASSCAAGNGKPAIVESILPSVIVGRSPFALDRTVGMSPVNVATLLPVQVPNPAFDAISRGLLSALLARGEEPRAAGEGGATPVPGNPLPPVTEADVCCCCVISLEEDPADRVGDSGPPKSRDGAGSVTYTLVLKVNETGGGRKCKCTLEWKEWSTTRYRKQGSSEKQRWLDQHKDVPKFFMEYDTFKKLSCRPGERIFRFTDTPSADGIGPHHIYIQVCAYSCVESGCGCAIKKKCKYLHVIHENGRTRLEGPSDDWTGFSSQPLDDWEPEEPGFREVERNRLRRERLAREAEDRAKKR